MTEVRYVAAERSIGRSTEQHINESRAVPDYGTGLRLQLRPKSGGFSKSGQNPAAANIPPEPDFWQDSENCT